MIRIQKDNWDDLGGKLERRTYRASSAMADASVGTWIKWLLWLVVVMAVVGIVLNYVGVFSTVARAPGQIIERTLEPDNVIYNYEWFHDNWAAYRAKLAQIETHKELIVDTPPGSEKNRLAVEIAAMRQKCRSIAEQYNANATKTNRSIFMGREAPETLDAQACN